MQKELDEFCTIANSRRMRKQATKILPSGVAPNFAYSAPEQFGGRNCLLPVDVTVVDEILVKLRQEFDYLTDWGVPEEFSRKAEEGIAKLRIKEITMTNVWIMFAALLNFV